MLTQRYPRSRRLLGGSECPAAAAAVGNECPAAAAAVDGTSSKMLGSSSSSVAAVGGRARANITLQQPPSTGVQAAEPPAYCPPGAPKDGGKAAYDSCTAGEYDLAAIAAALKAFSLRIDPMMPFDAKHAVQHASIVGESVLAADSLSLSASASHSSSTALSQGPVFSSSLCVVTPLLWRPRSMLIAHACFANPDNSAAAISTAALSCRHAAAAIVVDTALFTHFGACNPPTSSCCCCCCCPHPCGESGQCLLHPPGNMAAAGLLTDPQHTLFLELGAGKGFLTAWLHQVRTPPLPPPLATAAAAMLPDNCGRCGPLLLLFIAALEISP